MHLNIGDTAPDVALVTEQNEAIELKSLWANGPTVLTFLRHFG